MRSGFGIAMCLALLVSGCAKKSDQREYTLQGQVTAVADNHQQATIAHEAVKGFMPAMTMPYNIRDSRQLEGIVPGDLINATLVVVSNDAYLTNVKKVGQAPL